MPSNLDLNQLVAGAGDAIMVCDAEGLVTFWNAAAERIFGHTAAEAIGQSMDMIIPVRQRERHWAASRQQELLPLWQRLWRSQ